MINKGIGHIDEKNGNKYLLFTFADQNKKVLEKYKEFWNGSKNEIETINGAKTSETDKDFMKIKFGSDNDLPWNDH